MEIAFDRKKEYITRFVLRSLYFWKTYSDCQITEYLSINAAQKIIQEKKTVRKLEKEKRKARKKARDQSRK